MFQKEKSAKIARLDENIGSVSVELTPEDQSQIASATAKISVVGDRY